MNVIGPTNPWAHTKIIQVNRDLPVRPHELYDFCSPLFLRRLPPMADSNHNNQDGTGQRRNTTTKKKKKKNRGRKRVTIEQIIALNEVYDWAFSPKQTISVSAPVPTDDGFSMTIGDKEKEKKVVFEFHSHSTCSDGYLSPSALVDRAHRKGVSVRSR